MGQGGLERFQAKWKPVRVKKTRQINNSAAEWARSAPDSKYARVVSTPAEFILFFDLVGGPHSRIGSESVLLLTAR
jgi:hypothetical protein